MVMASLADKPIHRLTIHEVLHELKRENPASYVSQEQLAALERALELPLPGAPDEAWRRVPYDGYNFNELTLAAAVIQAEGEHVTRLTRHDRAADAACGRFLKAYGALFEKRRKRNKSRANDVTENKLYSFNEALSGDAYFVHVPKGTVVERPIKITMEQPETKRISLPVVFLHIEAGAAADVIIEQRGEPQADGTACVVLKGLIERDARLSLLRLQNVSERARFFGFDRVMIEENATLRADGVTIGAAVSMLEGLYSLMGAESRAELRELSGARGTQFSGMKLTVEHNAPHSFSDAAVKTVLDDASRGMFTGNIKIPAGSPHSQGYEEHRTLLLGDEAHVQSIPQLEIIENNVRCSHGSTVTSTVDDDLFYLRSRGLDAAFATRLLISAFYQDVLQRMDLPTRNEEARSMIMKPLREKTGLEFDSTEVW